MNPVKFPQANCRFGPPPDMSEAQVQTIYAYKDEAKKGSCDGSQMVVVAWKPDAHEIERINAGCPIFLTVLGGLPPHFITTDFRKAVNPA